jgi:hypothetical protein
MALERARWHAARAAGRRLSEDALYSFATDEILRFVRARNCYVRCSSRHDLERLSIETRVIYQRLSDVDDVE